MLEYFISAEIFIKKISNIEEINRKKALYLALNKTQENHFDTLKFILLLNNLNVSESIKDLEDKLQQNWINFTSDERINYQSYLRIILHKFLDL
jgi:hypothetical protein